MGRSRRWSVLMLVGAAALSSVFGGYGDVRIDTVADWREQAGQSVLAPLSCRGVNCLKVEKKFLGKAQAILSIESSGALESFLHENLEAPATEGEILAAAAELGFNSVLFGEATAERQNYYPESVTTAFTSLTLMRVDGSILLEGTATANGLTGISKSKLVRRLFLETLEEAERSEADPAGGS